jgi:hypothetical protein
MLERAFGTKPIFAKLSARHRYRPDLRHRQTTCDLAFIGAFFAGRSSLPRR